MSRYPVRLITFVCGLLFAGCPTNNGGDGGDASGCGEAGTAGDGGVCYVVSRCDQMNWCPAMVTNSATQPNFDLTQIDISQPPSLISTGTVGRLLNDTIATDSMPWGLALDFTGGMIRSGGIFPPLSTSSAQQFLTATFMFQNNSAPVGDAGTADRWNPGSTTLTSPDMGQTFSTGTISEVVIPIFNADATRSLLTELPLRNVRMHDVRITSGGNCIGFAKPNFNSCMGNEWITADPGADGGPSGTSYGVLEADLTIADAMNVNVMSLNTSLCNLVAGTNCSTMQPSMFRYPPDTMVGTTSSNNAWHVVANFAAVAVTIQ